MLQFLLLVYLSVSIALNARSTKLSSYKEGSLPMSGDPLLAIWGASLWPFLGLLWVTTPTLRATWSNAGLVTFTLLLLGLSLPLAVMIIPFAVHKIFPAGAIGLIFFGMMVWFLIVLGGGAAAWPPFGQLLLFLIFILSPFALGSWMLFDWVKDLVPLEQEEGQSRQDAMSLLAGILSGLPKPMWVIEKGKAKQRIRGSVHYGSGPGCVMTEPENAVVLKGQTAIRRVAGPGWVLTRADETIHSVIDLRQQLRTMEVKAITKDGINVKLAAAVIFRINPGRRSLRLRYAWPYARDDAWRVVFGAEVNPEGRTPLDAHHIRPWGDIPVEVAKNLLKQEMINHSLDDIYGLADHTVPRLKVAEEVRRKLAERVGPMGFEINDMSISSIAPLAEEVVQQRIEAWKARWIHQLMEWQGAVQARRFERFAALQNRARADLLSHLIVATNAAVQDTDDDFSGNLAAYYLLENLERIARDPEVRAFLPESALPALVELRQRVSEDDK
ncbi:MAG: SPFH domain-containing protein [Anaerolineae bacterium]|nr:SPFH domain-containing protein [Anaerolineae bacterium]